MKVGFTFSVLSILRVRIKWLIFNIILKLWADVKYHVHTGFGFSAKGCFLCFCFSPPSIYPLNQVFLLTGDSLLLVGGEIKKRKSGVISFFFVVETKGFEPLTSAMWLQRSKPAGLRLYFRLAMQSNKKFGDLATYWRFFLSWSGIFSGFS